jgi:Flp pilus assembly pilin Flp
VYGLIAAGISIAITVVVGSLGSSLNATFTSLDFHGTELT